MEEGERVERTPKFALSDKEPLLQPLGPGFFPRHAHEKRRWIKATVKKIGEEVTYKDLKPAIVYVADAAETRFTKVGFSKYPDETRPLEITKRCGVAFERTYRTTSFYCAFRAEQIVHDVLTAWAHDRLKCKCGKVNREWYKRSFAYIITLVNLVHTWIAREPYDLETRRLKDEWKEALYIWNSTQDTTKPLSWPEFFLVGLELHLLPKPLPASSHLDRRQKSASTTNISILTTPSPGGPA
jgi:hypothetical protein